MNNNIEKVKEFWEANPLWVGESKYEPGTLEFFEEHRAVFIDDCLAGSIDPRTIPTGQRTRNILDLGCGPGFWTVCLAEYSERLTAADLTDRALQLAEKRANCYGLKNITFSRENAESLTFDASVFSHVNCQGVIHHTPNTEACVKEIARVLEDGGSASLSVYYKNILLRNWKRIRWIGKLLGLFGAKLSGRGREGIFSEESPEEIVRLYDGKENPIGKSYTKKEFSDLLEPYFEVEEMYLHFFPARALPFRIPRVLHRFLDRNLGFMVYASVKKKAGV